MTAKKKTSKKQATQANEFDTSFLSDILGSTSDEIEQDTLQDDVDEELTEMQQAFRDARKKEQDRKKSGEDGDVFMVLVFPSSAHKEAFAAGLGDIEQYCGQYVDGVAFAKKTNIPLPPIRKPHATRLHTQWSELGLI